MYICPILLIDYPSKNHCPTSLSRQKDTLYCLPLYDRQSFTHTHFLLKVLARQETFSLMTMNEVPGWQLNLLVGEVN